MLPSGTAATHVLPPSAAAAAGLGSKQGAAKPDGSTLPPLPRRHKERGREREKKIEKKGKKIEKNPKKKQKFVKKK